VTRLNRLAMSTRDLLNTLDAVAEKGATFKSLLDTWADTTTSHGGLLLTVLDDLAEFERELIKARTGEGRRGCRQAVWPASRSCRRGPRSNYLRPRHIDAPTCPKQRMPHPMSAALASRFALKWRTSLCEIAVA
jgi:DNA invertase Pin-like site-specific DNA recombinase